MFHDLISFKKTYFHVYTFCISLHDIHFVYTIFTIFHQFFLMMIPDVVYAFCISSIFHDGNYVKIWPFLYMHFVYHSMIYTLYIIILYRHFAYTILPWNLGCIFHVDFGIQISLFFSHLGFKMGWDFGIQIWYTICIYKGNIFNPHLFFPFHKCSNVFQELQMCICDLISANVLGCKIMIHFGMQSCYCLNWLVDALNDMMFMALSSDWLNMAIFWLMQHSLFSGFTECISSMPFLLD